MWVNNRFAVYNGNPLHVCGFEDLIKEEVNAYFEHQRATIKESPHAAFDFLCLPIRNRYEVYSNELEPIYQVTSYDPAYEAARVEQLCRYKNTLIMFFTRLDAEGRETFCKRMALTDSLREAMRELGKEVT